MIKNEKLRKLFTKSPNFRELQSLNHVICKKEIDHVIEKLAGRLKLKYELEDTAMDLLEKKFKEKV